MSVAERFHWLVNGVGYDRAIAAELAKKTWDELVAGDFDAEINQLVKAATHGLGSLRNPRRRRNLFGFPRVHFFPKVHHWDRMTYRQRVDFLKQYYGAAGWAENLAKYSWKELDCRGSLGTGFGLCGWARKIADDVQRVTDRRETVSNPGRQKIITIPDSTVARYLIKALKMLGVNSIGLKKNPRGLVMRVPNPRVGKDVLRVLRELGIKNVKGRF